MLYIRRGKKQRFIRLGNSISLYTLDSSPLQRAPKFTHKGLRVASLCLQRKYIITQRGCMFLGCLEGTDELIELVEKFYLPTRQWYILFIWYPSYMYFAAGWILRGKKQAAAMRQGIRDEKKGREVSSLGYWVDNSVINKVGNNRKPRVGGIG